MFEVRDVCTILGRQPSLIGGDHFEVRLQYPECELTDILGYREIDTVMKYSDIVLWGADGVVLDSKSDNLNLFAGYDLTLDLTVKFHTHGNVKASSVVVTCAIERV